jgi:hypothetical protein
MLVSPGNGRASVADCGSRAGGRGCVVVVSTSGGDKRAPSAGTAGCGIGIAVATWATNVSTTAIANAHDEFIL